ncbi:F-box protein SKIP14-like isoform X2 [Durio zibethinus]|uniref:F-box protein SKIP14-like isoform X2 n=1 Tax=Durio zibethinus TaxID=66656 RepID=A0A6P6BB17_DURZI|nr:F-box protein SKIP14-like isoform X2 [Durio zibethinus]
MALNWDDFGNSWSCNWDVEKTHLSGSGNSESKGFSEAVNDDIVARLPADPFGMEIRSTFAAAITGWIEGFENDFGSDFCVFGKQDGDEKKIADQHLFKGLNWVWNGTMSFQQEQGNSSFYGFGSEDVDKKIGDQSSFFKGMNWVWNGTMSFQQEEGNFEINEISIPNDDFNGFGIGNGLSNGDFLFNDEGRGLEDCKGVFCDDNEGTAPNDALFFALGYLGVEDLLAVERVCRSLRDAVRSDPLLWRSIYIEHSLSKRITDDALLKLTSRAQGTLECLSLVGCVKITDDGLKLALESNPRLNKLSVPECTRLSVEGILSNLRAFRSAGFPGIKYLRIGGRFGVTEEQFKELKFLLGADKPMQLGAQKPQFFRQGQLHLMCDDDRAIDIEVCPRCQKLKLVYDCPSETCRRTHHAAQLCRACILCIARCICCGCCFKDCDYEETFTLDLLCFNCWKQILNREEKPEVMGASSSKHTVFHQETRYQFCFYG